LISPQLEFLHDLEADTPIAVVIGAASKIAQAIVANLLSRNDGLQIIAVSRQQSQLVHERLHWLQQDYSEESIAQVCACLSEPNSLVIESIFICNGILHDKALMPERSLSDFESTNYLQVHQVNTLIPMLWLKHLKRLFTRDSQCIVTVFSARIGSIDDNEKGGWYSYRASKAALNMLLKSVSIEVARSAKEVRFLVFHPGTTDTPLSKPFQKYVAEDKLFNPEFVAQQLLNIIDTLDLNKRIQFLAWDGKAIAW
jgi:NAD(P)-dependent dehydrogenase (short-subunit alcohol dehydrogenase family)